MYVYGELKKADLENLSADPTAGVIGRIYYNTVTAKAMLDDGTNIRAFLRNDGGAVLGNHATAGNNIRFHRGASSVLQLVTGGDATAEGTLSTSLAQLSSKIENYAFASLPAFGNAGRRAWVTDRSHIYVDTGSAWRPATTLESWANASLPAAATAGRLAWVTDKNVIKVDTGSAWFPACVAETLTNAGLPSAATAGRLAWVSDKAVLKVDTGAAWVVVGSAGAAGVLNWIEDVDSPTPTILNACRVYTFGAALSQYLYTTLRVPNSYVAGSQINMRALGYSTDTSGTVLFQTVCTLIRTGSDALSSTTNQRTSTNSAATQSAGTNGKPQSVVCDLTDSTGNINSVAVSAGDLLIVQFKRGTDTATGDASALMYGFEVTFG